MNEMVTACALGLVIGVILFFVCALTGYIDKWTTWLVNRSGRRKQPG